MEKKLDTETAYFTETPSKSKKIIILAAPNTASESLSYVINNYTNYRCYQIMTYPNYASIIQKRKIYFFLKRFEIKKALDIVYGYFFHSFINKYLRTNKLKFTNPTKDFEILSAFHSDICDFNLRLFIEFERFIFNHKNIILKQHFPPTENNLKFFKDFKKIILIRNTEHIIKKYNKHSLKLHHLRDYYKLKTEINIWKNKWISEKNTLIINSQDLITDSYKQLKRFEAFTDIEFNISDDFCFPHLNKTSISNEDFG